MAQSFACPSLAASSAKSTSDNARENCSTGTATSSTSRAKASATSFGRSGSCCNCCDTALRNLIAASWAKIRKISSTMFVAVGSSAFDLNNSVILIAVSSRFSEDGSRTRLLASATVKLLLAYPSSGGSPDNAANYVVPTLRWKPSI
jgi:hypothetical protein